MAWFQGKSNKSHNQIETNKASENCGVSNSGWIHSCTYEHLGLRIFQTRSLERSHFDMHKGVACLKTESDIRQHYES